jgi:glycosyltransferase involved in cell wall biosynthesis
MRNDTLVTVLICNHNYERYLEAAIDSALSQTYREVEVVVVDDGSTDGSRDILRRYGDRIRSVLKVNGGQPSALNAGFWEARGDIVCLLDADDVMAPTKAETVATIFHRNPEIGWVYHELDFIDAGGRAIPLSALPDRANVAVIRRRRARYPGFSRLDLRPCLAAGERLPYACPAFSGLSFRRRTLEAILPMPEDIARASDEFPKFAALALFPGVHLGESLASQRVHPANAATFRTDAPVERAIRYAKTAYHLRYRYAHIGRSMDKWFARSFGQIVGGVGPRAALAATEIRRYLGDYFGPLTLMRHGPRIAFHAARSWLARRRPARAGH